MTIDVGSERQLFLDDLFFESRSGVELKMHTPRAEEVMFQRDRPWEGRSLDTPCIVQDGDIYRMWYRADEGKRTDQRESGSWVCYAESTDCIHWDKPELGLVEYKGSRANNIVFPSEGIGGFAVKNPSVLIDRDAPDDERYKMVARTIGTKPTTMCGFVSADGLAWRSIEPNPILTEGPFDSHNIVVWDDTNSLYVMYLRGTDESVAGPFIGGRRAIRRSESADFRNWSPAELVLAPDEDDPEDFHLYTNAAVKYHRADRAYLMFPMTLYDERHYPTAPFHGLSDVIFASSRDGVSWQRRFREPFIGPGLDERNWCDRNPMMGAGIVETGPDELSMVFQELHKSEESRFRRCSLRLDGFVSVHAPYNGWSEFVTPPLRFDGCALELNYSTSGGGGIYVELQDEAGLSIPGYALEDCSEVFGDRTGGDVTWKDGPDLGSLANRPIRMRVRMRDADLFAFRFRPGS